MKTKRILKEFLSVSILSIVAFLSASSVYAADWAAGYNSGTGAISVGIGSNGSMGGSGGSWALSNPYGLPSGSILGIASNLLYWLLAIFAILGIIGFVISGIFYLLAGADEGNAKKGKSGMTASIIGIIVGLSGFVIMQAVAALLGGGDNKF
ncbi:MAG: hypothetical protein ACD_5C00228G0007 [uncultured bacterium]|nr:MAG: hypothetical protein ACD_5C00228G0007 [uncultured bacterium]